MEEVKRRLEGSLSGCKELLRTGALLYDTSKATAQTVWKVFHFLTLLSSSPPLLPFHSSPLWLLLLSPSTFKTVLLIILKGAREMPSPKVSLVTLHAYLPCNLIQAIQSHGSGKIKSSFVPSLPSHPVPSHLLPPLI